MKFSSKAEIGWSFIVKFIIGLLVLLVLIIVAANAKKGFSGLLAKLAGIF